MKDARLQVGIDFSKKRADVGLFGPEGEVIEMHCAFSNSRPGYEAFKQLVIETMQAYEFDGLNITGEATSYYWMPFFLELAGDEELAEYGLHQFLLNPRWVHWHKKGFPSDHKTDEKDPYYIADRTRVHRPTYEWRAYKDWLPLRFYTRLRFHLVQMLIREKNYCHAYLFLINSAYTQQKPFTDTFGATSCKILAQQDQLDALCKLGGEELAAYLFKLSEHRLHDTHKSAQKLKRVAAERFQLDEALVDALQQVVNLLLQNIHFIQAQIKHVDAMIAEEAKSFPQIQNLATIPGIGPVFASGIVAEIGDLNRFFEGQKWDRKHKCYRPKNLRDVDAAIAKLSGLWWPRSASGDFEAEDRRLKKSGNRYLRYYLIEAADRLRQFTPAYSVHYQKKYGEVNKFRHKRALVLTARRSIRLIVGLLHRNEPYRPQEA